MGFDSGGGIKRRKGWNAEEELKGKEVEEEDKLKRGEKERLDNREVVMERCKVEEESKL